jgi:ParB family transcriptional regulator, chromosome partitioning protein
MTTTDTAPATAPVLEHHDPAALVIDLNIRDDIRLDDGLVDSIRERGVLEPVVGYRTGAGAIRVRFGHRRTLAAITAGLAAIPVVVHDTDPGDAVERILGQYDENTHREGLSANEKAGVATQLLDLGLTTADVVARTRLPEHAVAAARAIRESKAAATVAAARPELTLDQVAAVAELGDDKAAVKKLVDAAEDGTGRFRHTLEQLRADKAEQAARDDLTARLKAEGATIAESYPGWSSQLDQLQNDKGKKITPRGHKACPGHAAHIQRLWSQAGIVFKPVYFCADPKANGHQALGGGAAPAADGPDLEAQRAERQRTLAGNKLWRAAETVRRQWLTGFIAAKTPPKTAARFIAESLARNDGCIWRAMERGNSMACELGAVPARPAAAYGEQAAAATGAVAARAGDGRAQVITLGIILAAYEGATTVDTWRGNGTDSLGGIRRYLQALAGWGYELSPIEQAVADGQQWQPAAAPAPAGTGDQEAASA